MKADNNSISNLINENKTKPSYHPDDLDIDPSSYIDPNGFVFHLEQNIYRAIRPHVIDFYQALLTDGTAQRLIKAYKLVPTKKVDLSLPQLAEHLIVEHERIKPVTYCNEWCSSMLKAAAVTTLELAIELAHHDLMLQDAYPWNVVFQGTSPIFVDFTSIVPVEKNYIWPAYSQYQAFFQRTLILSGMKKNKLARLYLFDNLKGITFDEFYKHTSFLYRCSHPSIVVTNLMSHILRSSTKLYAKLNKMASEGTTVTQSIRIKFLKRLLSQASAFSFDNQSDVWADYYQQIPSFVDKQAKINIVERILQQVKPSSVVDLGCNTGIFSLLAAKNGAKVMSIDSSESCIEALYTQAKKDNLDITPVISDVLCTTPPYGVMGAQYNGLVERAESELTLCLGLMHHLHIVGRQPFTKIALLLAKFTQKYLIFEYVDYTDLNVEILTVKPHTVYDFDEVNKALSQYFSSIELFTSDRETRKILLCTK